MGELASLKIQMQLRGVCADAEGEEKKDAEEPRQVLDLRFILL